MTKDREIAKRQNDVFTPNQYIQQPGDKLTQEMMPSGDMEMYRNSLTSLA